MGKSLCATLTQNADLRTGVVKFSSVEEDELAIFLLPMPVSLPGVEVGVSALFRMISFSFEAIRGERCHVLLLDKYFAKLPAEAKAKDIFI